MRTNPQPEHEGPIHEPAMVPQVLRVLDPLPGRAALDVTVGTGGHSLAIAEALGPGGRLVGLDADPRALRTARARLQRWAPCRVRLFHGRFTDLPRILTDEGLTEFDLLLADLGVGTHQLMQPERGFSFQSESRLDMRYDPAAGPSAWDVVNTAERDELADIFRRYGEERYSRAIAESICRRRREATVDTPAELAELVKRVYARRSPRDRTWRIHPATRVMMALRIHVNREMEELDLLLKLIPRVLKRGGRAAVLTYHSLEARRVKNAWRKQAEEGRLEELPDSPLLPTEEQTERNPRVRSAQLRASRRL
ncbi:MAG: 16S rRNA (cytosine(1402)-N(4))-methyltransferase RsmH [Planctomycetota bacterium]